MARLEVLEYPDPRLRTRAEPVRTFDAELSRLIDDMFETLHATGAIGLASTQVNVHRQVIAMDVSAGRDAPQAFVNPSILSCSAIALVEESCLSVPGLVESVERATRLRVRALDRTGTPFERDLDGLQAVCLQHEIDHLHGRLFVDRLPFFRRLRTRRKLDRDRRALAERVRDRVAAGA
jgi:peptide deformylase